MRRSRSVAVALAVVSTLAVLLAGCATPEPRAAIPAAADLRGARFVVGGGPDDQMQILCQLTVAAVEAAGAAASDQCARFGALDVRLPARRSFVDTAWASLARPDRDLDGRGDPPTTFEALVRADAPRGLTWFPPSAFADGDAVVVTGATAAGGVRTVSALATRPGTWCVPPGTDVTGLLAAYRPVAGVRVLDRGAVVAELVRGTCTAALLRNTSGYVPALGLVPLADDRGVLGRAGVAPVVRSEVAARHPGVGPVLAVLTTRLTDDVVRGLNREVTLAGRDARDVAREWLDDQGLT